MSKIKDFVTNHPIKAALALIFTLSVLQYANTFGHQYAWDDLIVILDNTRVQAGIEGIPEMFYKYVSFKLEHAYGYRPTSLITHAIDTELFEMETPQMRHVMSVLYFGVLCMVLFLTLKRLLYNYKPILPFLVTLLFIVHPIHVEAVANIKSRDEILALLFCLLSLNFFIRFYFHRKWYHAVGVFVFLLLGFTSKEGAVTFLGVYALTFVWLALQETTYTWHDFKQNSATIFKKIDWTKQAKRAAILGAAFVFFGMAIFIPRQISTGDIGVPFVEGGLVIQEDIDREEVGFLKESPGMGNNFYYIRGDWSQTLSYASLIMGKYLKNFLVPYPLVYFYGYNQVPVTDWTDWRVLLSAFLHLFFIGWAVVNLRKRALVAYGILYYITTISLYTNIVRRLNDTMADRFLFAPSVGLCLIAVVALAAIFGLDFKKKKAGTSDVKNKEPLVKASAAGAKTNFFKKNNPAKNTKKRKSKASLEAAKKRQRWHHFSYTFAILLLVYFVLTFNRNWAWENNEVLTAHDMPNMENCAKAHYFYGINLSTAYEANPTERLKNKIIYHFGKSIEISDEMFFAYIKLGRAYMVFGMWNEAFAVLNKCIELYPEQSRPHFHAGYGYFKAGHFDKAIVHLEKAVAMSTLRQDAYQYLAYSYHHSGQSAKGLETIQKAVETFSGNMDHRGCMADIQFQMGLQTEAIETLKYILEKEPDNQEAYKMIIDFSQKMGDEANAALYEQAAKSNFSVKKN